MPQPDYSTIVRFIVGYADWSSVISSCLFASGDAGGRPREHKLRRMVDAMLYVVKMGCQWRQLPENFPPWKTVHEQFRSWGDSGMWERVAQENAAEAAHEHGIRLEVVKHPMVKRGFPAAARR